MASPYTTSAHMQSFFESLGADLTAETGSVFGESKCAIAINSATGVINSAIAQGGIYTVPIPDTATEAREMIQPHADVLSLAFLLGTRMADISTLQGLFGITKDWLNGIAKKGFLGSDAPVIPKDDENVRGSYQANDVIYTKARWGRI